MLETRITKTFGMSTPVVSAGMAFVSRPELAAAVSNAGGMGFVAAEMTPPHELANLVSATRRLTARPFGIEFMRPYFTEWHLELCIAAPVAVVTFLWGNPERTWVEQIQAAGSRVWVKVRSVDEARLAALKGVDGLIVEMPPGGPEYVGGRLIKLLADVVDSVGLPVVLSASAVDGLGLIGALMMGAEAVRCGTLFLGAAEANAEVEYARAMADSPVDATLRVNLLTREWPDRPTAMLTSHVVREWMRSRCHSRGESPSSGAVNRRKAARTVPATRLSEVLSDPDVDEDRRATGKGSTRRGVGDESELGVSLGTDPIRPAASILEHITSEAREILGDQQQLCSVA